MRNTLHKQSVNIVPGSIVSSLALIVVLGSAGPAMAATFTVTRNTDNPGVCLATPFIGCSLRQAITSANAATGSDIIVFNIPGCGAKTIDITGDILRITGRVIIDGSTQPRCGAPVPGDRASLIELRGPGSQVFPGGQVRHGLVLVETSSSGSRIRGLAINSFSGAGIGVASSSNIISDNKLGTDLAGHIARPNGIGLSINDTGNDNSVFDNVVSGNLIEGVHILGDGNQLFGNLIGTTVEGDAELRNNGPGIATFGANNNEIGLALGLGNTVAFNADAGVSIGIGSGNSIIGNRMLGNGGLGIVLVGAGANHAQVAPVLQSARFSYEFNPGPPPSIDTVTTIRGTLAGAANGGFEVDLYGNAACDPSEHGEGETMFATVAVNTNGTFVVKTGSPIGAFVTAVARSSSGDASQFSNCIAVTR